MCPSSGKAAMTNCWSQSMFCLYAPGSLSFNYSKRLFIGFFIQYPCKGKWKIRASSFNQSLKRPPQASTFLFKQLVFFVWCKFTYFRKSSTQFKSCTKKAHPAEGTMFSTLVCPLFVKSNYGLRVVLKTASRGQTVFA